MYQLGHRAHHRQKLYATLILLFAGLSIAGIWGATRYFQPDTTLSSSEAIVRHVDVAKPATKTITTATFTMDIPKSWRAVPSNLTPAAPNAWRGTGAQEAARSIEVYVDALPGSMAVNRLLPVHGNGDQLAVGDSISDNCTSFTDNSQVDKKTGTALAKWSGVNFYCDAANYERNVIGTGSPEAINSVTLKGKQSGGHRYFFVYTDNSAEPDDTLLTTMLDSFRVK